MRVTERLVLLAVVMLCVSPAERPCHGALLQVHRAADSRRPCRHEIGSTVRSHRVCVCVRVCVHVRACVCVTESVRVHVKNNYIYVCVRIRACSVRTRARVCAREWLKYRKPVLTPARSTD